ncbi:hypothetical protein Tco_0795100 [Tanacetum coccineum]
MTTLAEFMIIAGADNRPPMLEKSLTKRYEELSVAEKLQDDCDLKATNIIVQGLPPDVYAIVNHHKVSKAIWDRVKLLMQGTKLSLQEKECLVVPVFNQGDDPIACLNKGMAFLIVVVSSRFLSTDNQLRTSSNPRNQTTILDGKGHMARQCTQPKRPRNTAWFKEKAMLAEAQESSQILDEEQLAFLDLDAYDYDCDDVSNAKAVLMANLSNYGSDVISKMAVQDNNLYAQQDSMILSVIEQMLKQMINHVNNWETANHKKNNESLTAELERYKERVKTFEQHLNIDLSTREKMIDSQMNDMIKEKLALKQQINSLEQNLSNQIKEKEYLLQTFTVLKNESKEKESKYMDKEIDLEKKINSWLSKSVLSIKAQRIKPTLYDGSVISSQHATSLVIDDEETLILKEGLESVSIRHIQGVGYGVLEFLIVGTTFDTF